MSARLGEVSLMLSSHTLAPGEQLELDALKVCFEEAKKSENTALYKEATSLIGGRLGQEYDPDAAWMVQGQPD